MLDKQSKKKLDKYMERKRRNLCRGLYITYRHFNEWAEKKWKEDGWGDLRPEHLRLISIISLEQVNNNELAKRARVSKQAMSKMVNDLEQQGFVDIIHDPNDSRAKIISISNKGVTFFEYFTGSSQIFEGMCKEKIGDKKMKGKYFAR